MNALAGLGVSISVVVTAIGVFLLALCVYAVVKILQIAEDVRYMRSRVDLKVERPRSYKEDMKACMMVSAVVTFVLTFGIMFLSGLTR